jgi:hypothetical protein
MLFVLFRLERAAPPKRNWGSQKYEVRMQK